MSEYPQDIIDAAKQAERVLMGAPFPNGGWQAIAKALLSERMSKMTVLVPEQWEPCSPSWLERGGDCACAPRVWNEAEKNHWHPKP